MTPKNDPGPHLPTSAGICRQIPASLPSLAGRPLIRGAAGRTGRTADATTRDNKMNDSEDLNAAIAELARAVAFLDACKRDVAAAASTGAYSDALDYIESGARAVIAAAVDRPREAPGG